MEGCVCCLGSYYDNDGKHYICGNPESQEYLDEVDEGYICEEYEGLEGR